MAPASDLTHLRLYREDNALQEVTVSLFFQEPLPIEQIDELASTFLEYQNNKQHKWHRTPLLSQSNHINFKKNENDKLDFSVVKGVEFNLGYQFTSPQAGNPNWVIRMWNYNPGNRFQITIHGLQYTRWEQFLSDVMDLLFPFSSKGISIPFKAYGVQNMDVFYWETATYPPLDQILTKQSEWIPVELIKSTGEIKYSLTKSSETNNNTTRHDTIQFFLTKSDTKYTLTLMHHLAVEPENPIEWTVAAILRNNLQQIHDQNKAMIDRLLTKQVTDKMKGFTDKRIVSHS